MTEQHPWVAEHLLESPRLDFPGDVKACWPYALTVAFRRARHRGIRQKVQINRGDNGIAWKVSDA